MGLFISKLTQLFQQDTRVLMLGLDAAGKTTVLYKLKLGELVTTIPTVGFNVESVKYKNLDMTIWDVGGQDKIRPLWKHYYTNTDVLIYVVDSNDPDRIGESRDELHKVLNQDELQNAVVLVLANKQDLPRAQHPEMIIERLGLHSLRKQQWYLQPCSATSGDGIIEGFEWVQTALRKMRSNKSNT